MPGTSNFGHFDHFFPIEKSQFCHFAYQGSVKMPFDPILTPFWALLSPTFLALAKMCLFAPFDRMDLGGTLRDPKFDLKLTIWTPFEGPGGRLQLDPRTSCLWAGGPAQSLTNPCRDLKFWSFWPLLTSFWVQNKARGVKGRNIVTFGQEAVWGPQKRSKMSIFY